MLAISLDSLARSFQNLPGSLAGAIGLHRRSAITTSCSARFGAGHRLRHFCVARPARRSVTSGSIGLSMFAHGLHDYLFRIQATYATSVSRWSLVILLWRLRLLGKRAAHAEYTEYTETVNGDHELSVFSEYFGVRGFNFFNPVAAETSLRKLRLQAGSTSTRDCL